METPKPLLDVPDNPRSASRIYIQEHLWFVDRDGYRVIFLRHEPIYRTALEDEIHLRFIAVSLRQSELATQEQITKALGHSVKTQRRWERRYEKEGLEGLGVKSRSGRPRHIEKAQETIVRRWFNAGSTNAEMAARLGVGAWTVSRTLDRLGLERKSAPELPFQATSPVETDAADGIPGVVPQENTIEEDRSDDCGQTCELDQSSLNDQEVSLTSQPDAEDPSVQDSTEPKQISAMPVGPSIDQNPLDRWGDRAMARLGLLDDARPLFADADELPRAGVLLAIPLFVVSGIPQIFHEVYQSVAPAFYGLRTTIVSLFLFALLRINRPEQLKEFSPCDLGRILGLDRAPEVKTVRRKLTILAAKTQAHRLMKKLAQRRIAEDEQRIAFLYIDGHVREYHGKHAVSKTKKAQRQVAGPAMTDTWVNDAQGDPLLVVSSEMNAGLTQMLEPILEDVKGFVPPNRRVTVVFDRGGYSPKLFSRLIHGGFDVLTYRKGRFRKLARGCFKTLRRRINGKWYSYELCDQLRVKVGRLQNKSKKRKDGPQFLWMRQVTVLRDDGRQTHILTSRSDLHAVEVSYWMFNRWRQENFFKYMDQEFALDALVEYGVKDVSEGVDCPNPKWSKGHKDLEKKKAKLQRLQAELGAEVASNREDTRRTMRGFKIAHQDLRQQLKQAETGVRRLTDQLSKIPKRIPATDLKALKNEKKAIVDAIKMSAYQMETQLLRMLHAHYPRSAEEGRTLLHAAFQSSAQLHVCNGELRVTIAAQSSPHRTRALANLCKELHKLDTVFPGTDLRLRLAVEAHQPVTF
ncbi:MAG: helix-turn-helix domain-containing protein [Dehalococcoidia bacterium]|nr:helix-turn-helix domain-containing protein [Dehalococcoidia bacterium]